MGEVISRNTGFTAFSSQIWGFVVFHTVTMALGLFFIELAAKRKRTADSAQSP
jgi:hypothetical protein